MNRKQIHETYNDAMRVWQLQDDMIEADNELAGQMSLKKRDALVRQFVRQWNAVAPHAQVKVVEDTGLAVSWEIA